MSTERDKRLRIATAALQGMLSDSETIAAMVVGADKAGCDPVDFCIHNAYRHADALIRHADETGDVDVDDA